MIHHRNHTETGPSRLYYIRTKFAKFYSFAMGRSVALILKPAEFTRSLKLYLRLFHLGEYKATSKCLKFQHAYAECVKWKTAIIGDKGQLWKMKESIFVRFQQKLQSKGVTKSGEHVRARRAFCESRAVSLQAG